MSGRQRAISIVFITGLLVGVVPGAGPAAAVPDPRCSTFVTPGSINSETAFNEAVGKVNLGLCSEIDVSGTITFTAAPTQIDPPPSITTLTISGTNSGVLDGKDGSAAAVRGMQVQFWHLGQQLVISNLTIREFAGGSGASGGALNVYGGALSITGSTFTGNSTTDGQGGAIYTGGDVTVADSTFSGNSASSQGGAIVTIGSLISSNSLYQNNSAVNGGGAVVTVSGVTSTADDFLNNSVSLLDGGALDIGGTFRGNGSRFEGNSAYRNGGAIRASSCIDINSVLKDNVAGAGAGSGYGGALVCSGAAPAAVDLTRTRFTDNVADIDGGALWTTLAIDAVNATFQGNDALNGGAIRGDAAITLEDTDFTGNTATNPGSSPGLGGAIFVYGSSSIAIDGGLFDNNLADGDGGAIFTNGAVNAQDVDFDSNNSGLDALDGGGAIKATGAVSVSRSIFTDNGTQNRSGGAIRTDAAFTAQDSTFTRNGHRAGGSSLADGGAVSADGAVTIVNSLFESNVSLRAAGAIFTRQNAEISDSEFSGNTSVNEGGAGRINGSLTIVDSIVENNVASTGNPLTTIGDGGAFFVNETTTVEGSTFRSNSGQYGGALHAKDLVVSNSSFIGNEAVYGGAADVSRSTTVTNSTFYGNTARIFGSALHLNSGITSAAIRFSTLINPASGSFPYGSVITSGAGTPALPLTLTGSVMSGPSPVCGFAAGTEAPLDISAASRSSFTTDSSCDSPTVDAVRTTSHSSLRFDTPLATDDTTGTQVLIPGVNSVLNDYAPISLLPSGVTTDQLGALRNSSDGLTTVGAVQVRAMSASAPSNQSVAAGASASFSTSATPGVGTSVSYQWQSSRDGTSWSNITANASAITPSLTLTSVPVSDSGLQVRARVTDLGGSAFSSAATLTVSSPPAPGPGPAEPSPSATPTSESTPTPAEPTSAVPSAQIPSTIPATLNVRLVGIRAGSEVVVRGVMKERGVTRVRPMYKVVGRSTFVRGKTIPVGRTGTFTWRHRSDKAVVVYFSTGRERSPVVRIGANPRA